MSYQYYVFIAYCECKGKKLCLQSEKKKQQYICTSYEHFYLEVYMYLVHTTLICCCHLILFFFILLLTVAAFQSSNDYGLVLLWMSQSHALKTGRGPQR